MKWVHEFPLVSYNQKAADFLADYLTQLLEEREMLHVALSGGSTPIPILELLQKKKLDWARIQFFLVDERCVPQTSSDSNYGNLANAFFSVVPSDSFVMYREERGIEGSVM
ncbi:MAG: 6-phosphogluconolactonase, partial [Flavobacteriaceae bacterium]